MEPGYGTIWRRGPLDPFRSVGIRKMGSSYGDLHNSVGVKAMKMVSQTIPPPVALSANRRGLRTPSVAKSWEPEAARTVLGRLPSRYTKSTLAHVPIHNFPSTAKTWMAKKCAPFPSVIRFNPTAAHESRQPCRSAARSRRKCSSYRCRRASEGLSLLFTHLLGHVISHH